MLFKEEILEEDEKVTSGVNISYWLDRNAGGLEFEPLKKNIETDVVIIGGGITGLSIAYCLCLTGKKVAVVEDGYIASGESGRTSAHLVNALDDRYYTLLNLYGEEKSKLIAESHTKAIEFIKTTSELEKIDCDFKYVDGYLFLHPSDSEDSLDKEFEAVKKSGIDAAHLDHTPGIKKNVGSSIKFRRQAQFDPVKYLKGLCTAIKKYGGEIYTSTHAKKVEDDGIITDKNFKVTAKDIVIATNATIDKVTLYVKLYPFRTYIIGATVPKDSVPEALWWDTGDFNANSQIPPYHYIRRVDYDSRFDLLIIGGEDHHVGLAEDEYLPEENRYEVLENWAREHFDLVEIVYKWSGQIMEPMDSLAYIGRAPMEKNNVYMATGDSGNGLTHGTIAGMLISDLINGVENPWREIYKPSRFKLKASGIMFKEFVGEFLTYLKHKPSGEKTTELHKLEKGTGNIFSEEGKRIGIYRDENDCLHVVSSECMHMGCIVKWNNDEKTWDCPCHGSRYSYDGKVMNGPANKNLEYHLSVEKDFFNNK